MTGSAELHAPFESSAQEAAAPLESILCTEECQSRPSRPPDHEKENSALVALCSALADSTRTILQTLADEVLDVLGADAAGLSLLTMDGNTFYWAAIAGARGPHIGGATPRDFGPCGDVLDYNAPMLTTKTDGVGIGLSVSRSIIETHHGRLWAEPHDGPGATFSFSSPVRPDSVTDLPPK